MPEIELDLGVQLIAGIEGMAAKIDRAERYRQRMAQAIRQIPITAPPMNLASGAGVIDVPDLLAVKTGFMWSVRRLTLYGFTAGTATVLLNSQFGEPVAPFPQAAVFTFGRGELLMHPGDRLVTTATGITGSVTLAGAADCFEQWYLPHYIG